MNLRLRTLTLFAGMVCLLLFCATATRADVAIYPGDRAYFFDVKECSQERPFCAKGNGIDDDSAAIQRAINAILDIKRDPSRPMGNPGLTGHHTLYFPNGTYRVTSRLTLGSETKDAGTDLPLPLAGNIHVKGQSRNNTIIRLDDGRFTDVANPQIIFSFFDGGSSNNLFGTTIEDLTINSGSNNPGAIALNFHNNNYGYVRRVTLKSEDGQGAIGLRLGQLNAGIGYVKDIEVQGFDYGIVNYGVARAADTEARGTTFIAYVLEHITLSRQNIGGVLNRDKALSIRKLTSTNSVPAVIQQSSRVLAAERDNGLVVIVDSTLQGGAANQPALNNIDGWLVARGVTATGYRTTVTDHGQDYSFVTGEHVTGDAAFALWPGVGNAVQQSWKTLNLPVQETPEVAQDPQSEWAIVDTALQGDDTAAIQAAIDSGKTTVFLQRGAYTVSGTIVINNNVRRFNANWSQFEIKGPFASTPNPLFRFEDGTHPVVVFEAYTRRGYSRSAGYFMQNNSSRTLVLRDLAAAAFEGGIYRNTGTGRLFIEDIVSGAGGGADPNALLPVVGWEFKNQEVWARHFNPEGSYPHCVNDGGKLWVLGFKAGEGHGPYFVTKNGGQSEILGGIFNNLARADEYPPNATAVEIVDAEVSISGLETSKSNSPQQPHPVMVRETRGGGTRELLGTQVPERADRKSLNAHALPLYYTPNTLPTVALTAPSNNTNFIAGATITITANATDTDGTLSRVEFYADGIKLGEAQSAPYSFAWGDVGAGNYQLTVRATDNRRGSATSTPVRITVSAPTPTPTPTPAPIGTGTGLLGRYYNSAEPSIGSHTERTDAVINFDWGSTSPVPGLIAADTCSVRWSGQVQPRYSQTYTFYTQTDDGVRLWVNGQLLIDDWTTHGVTERSGQINVMAGQKYNLRMEYFNNQGQAVAKLLWSSASQAKQIIPSRQLYSGPAEVLFFDGFEDGDAYGWTPTGGVWQVVLRGGAAAEYEYRKVSIDNNIATAGLASWRDYAVAGELKTESEEGAPSILGRVKDSENYYQLGVDKDKGSGQKKWWLRKRVNGNLVEMESGRLEYAANQGVWLQLRMEGTRITAYKSVDGGESYQRLGSGVEDATYSTGKIGVRGWDAACRFDNIKVVVR